MSEGYIYFIQVCNDDKYIKIGRTKKNCESRLAQLQTASPYQLRLIASFFFENVEEVEKELHEFFKDRRLVGEWFIIEPKEILSHMNRTYASWCNKSDLDTAKEVVEKIENEPIDNIFEWEERGHLRVLNGGKTPDITFRRFRRK
ncbi:hypothetical protein GF380_01110 [Candidatus Uhrbacteria bacterium]|nr:hypothetical protein [Candidatus Uhrbacteria bacterium]